jgi:predicted RNA binding protein YcfA (HicA-like mRNA interferase family)
MPKKIRELKADLLKAGFSFRTGKGRHTIWSHPDLARSITLSVNDGADAKPDQKKAVSRAIRGVEERS